MRNLADLRVDHRAAILKKWFDLTVDSYPADTAVFLKREGDPFRNPIGSTISEALTSVYEAIGGEMDEERMAAALDDVVKVAAVQETSPSRALGFVFLLKRALREALADQLRDPHLAAEVAELDSRVDAVALIAFDLFVKHRERVFEIRANEMKNRTSILLERVNRFYDRTEATSRERATLSRRGGGE
jgi:hypothetical protein